MPGIVSSRKCKDCQHPAIRLRVRCLTCLEKKRLEARTRRAAGINVSRHDRGRYLQQKYGITLEQFQQRLVSQGYRCKLCALPLDMDWRSSLLPVVDHSHTTGEVRGILHKRCNAALGMFNDDPTFLKQALEYLG